MLKKEKIDYIISSPLNRCLDTISETAKFHNIEVEIDSRLRETDCGEDDGKKSAKPMREWEEKRAEGAESFAEMYIRMKEFIEDINSKYQGKTIAIVSHGHPLWMAKKVIKDFDFDTEILS